MIMHKGRKTAIAMLALLMLIGGALYLGAQDAPEMPEMPGPEPEHAWLKQLVGEWESIAEVKMAPDQPAQQFASTDTCRMLGEFWMIQESEGKMAEMPFNSILTLGYDPETDKYVGTWVDSMGSHLWRYEGTVDEEGKVLTLETEGPCPLKGMAIGKFRERVEIVNPDHRIFTSTAEDENGEWVTMVTIHSTRKGTETAKADM